MIVLRLQVRVGVVSWPAYTWCRLCPVPSSLVSYYTPAAILLGYQTGQQITEFYNVYSLNEIILKRNSSLLLFRKI
jgi:hypothetical protein